MAVWVMLISAALIYRRTAVAQGRRIVGKSVNAHVLIFRWLKNRTTGVGQWRRTIEPGILVMKQKVHFFLRSPWDSKPYLRRSS
jgi:hypothetical protein